MSLDKKWKNADRHAKKWLFITITDWVSSLFIEEFIILQDIDNRCCRSGGASDHCSPALCYYTVSNHCFLMLLLIPFSYAHAEIWLNIPCIQPCVDNNDFRSIVSLRSTVRKALLYRQSVQAFSIVRVSIWEEWEKRICITKWFHGASSVKLERERERERKRERERESG